MPLWSYIAMAQIVTNYAWQIGNAPAPHVATPDVRIVQHVIILLLSIPMYMLALKTGFPAGRRWSAGAVQLLLAFALATLARPAFIVSWLLFMPDKELALVSPLEAPNVWLGMTFDYLVFYGFGLALAVGVATYLELRDEKLRASRLQNEWMQSRMQALRMQLNPHFLFNTLHTTAALIGSRPKVAEKMVVRLSDLLRRVLQDRDEEQIPLWREMEFAGYYLDIERLRFEDRLTVSLKLEPCVREALVPSLILQPLLENAVKHGIADDRDAVEIGIDAQRSSDWLELVVHNSGPGPDHDGRNGCDGLGLENTRARLDTMFGDRYQVEAGYAAPGQFVARVRIPFALAGNRSIGR